MGMAKKLEGMRADLARIPQGKKQLEKIQRTRDPNTSMDVMEWLLLPCDPDEPDDPAMLLRKQVLIKRNMVNLDCTLKSMEGEAILLNRHLKLTSSQPQQVQQMKLLPTKDDSPQEIQQIKEMTVLRALLGKAP